MLPTVLTREGVTKQSVKQLKQAKEKAMEEFFAILFLCMADHQKYRKVIEEMEIAMLQKKDPFPKNVSDACGLLNGWSNKYGGWYICTEAIDGVAFTTMSEDKDVGVQNDFTGLKYEYESELRRL